MTEVWRDVPGWEGFYQVSSIGRVRSVTRRVSTGRGGFRVYVGRVLRQSTASTGHRHVNFSRNGHRSIALAHRLVLLAFVGPCPVGMEACHNDGDESRNHVDNLRWDTRSSNMQDRTRHGNDRNAAKRACPSGHPYNELNTYPIPTGGRGCRACRNEASRRHRARKQAVA